ncbi:hypothetical protein [Streptomyces rimosus]|nr:hypothetical protein [Streptomyces rimosus]
MPGTNGDRDNPQSDDTEIKDTGQPDTGDGEGQGSDEDKMGGGAPGQ